MKIFKMTTIGIGLLMMVLINASVYAEELTVKKVTRLMHPGYQNINYWFGIRNPWNRDYTRIMMFEDTAFTHPEYGTTGRWLVWGYVDNLKSWATLAEYRAAAKPLPYINGNQIKPMGAYWSPFAGEENIIYLLTYKSSNLYRLNVDTGAVRTVTSFDPGDGTNISNTIPFGWTSDNTLILHFEGDTNTGGGYEVNVQTGAKNRYYLTPSVCSAEGWRWPAMLWTHGHSHKSPDNKRVAFYGSGAGAIGVQANEISYCTTKWIDNTWPSPPPIPTHVSWKSSNDWYVAEDMGEWNGGQTSPYIAEDKIYQIYFNRETHTFDRKTLLVTKTAGYWKSQTTTINWQAMPIPTLRPDGGALVFQGTDGKYSYDDYLAKGKTPWGTVGFFLAEFASTTDSTPPASPVIMDVR